MQTQGWRIAISHRRTDEETHGAQSGNRRRGSHRDSTRFGKKGAADWFSLLDKQIDKAQSDDEKDAYKAQKSFLEESLKAQSKLNSKGFKLKNLNATNIQVEELTYYTDEESPTFGNVKSQTSYLIDKDGKEVEKSRKRTSIEHAADAEDKREHAITIKVKADKIELVSSQKRAGVDEHILQTQDSDAYKPIGCTARTVWWRVSSINWAM